MHRLFENSAEIDNDVDFTLGNTMEMQEIQSTTGLSGDTNIDMDQVNTFILSWFNPTLLTH